MERRWLLYTYRNYTLFFGLFDDATPINAGYRGHRVLTVTARFIVMDDFRWSFILDSSNTYIYYFQIEKITGYVTWTLLLVCLFVPCINILNVILKQTRHILYS